MQLLDSGDRRLGVFLMISILIHGGLLLAFPQLRELGTIGSAYGRPDGVMQVVRVEGTSIARSPSAKVVAAKPKAALKPEKLEKKEEVKPKSEPKPQPKKEVAKPKPTSTVQPATKVEKPEAEAAVVKPKVETKPQVAKKQEVPKRVEPAASAQPKSDPGKPTGLTNAGLLTSENGQEVAVTNEPSRSSVVSSSSETRKETETKEETIEESKEVSSEPGSEMFTKSESSSELAEEVGTETAPVPAPLPPLPGAGGIFPRYTVVYPKGAQNEDAGGTWIGSILFPTGGKSPVVLSIDHATGNSTLDGFAKVLVEKGMQYPDSGVDYVATVEISFTGSPDYAVRVKVDKIDYAQ